MANRDALEFMAGRRAYAADRWHCWLAYNSLLHDTPSHAVMTEHHNWAMITAPLYCNDCPLVNIAYPYGQEIWRFTVGLMLVALGLLGATAWRGGEVIYRHGLGVMSLPKADNHGHAVRVADNHDDTSAEMKEAGSHGVIPQAEDDLHTHVDSTQDRH